MSVKKLIIFFEKPLDIDIYIHTKCLVHPNGWTAMLSFSSSTKQWPKGAFCEDFLPHIQEVLEKEMDEEKNNDDYLFTIFPVRDS